MILDILIFVALLALCGFLFHTYRNQPAQNAAQAPSTDLSPLLKEIAVMANKYNGLEDQLKTMPHKVLESLRGSASNIRGDLGEYIQLLKLKADYDIIIPIGDIIDYIGIRFDDAENGIEGKVDFIEVKTNNSRLSHAQKRFRYLVNKNLVGFKQVTVRLNDLKEHTC